MAIGTYAQLQTAAANWLVRADMTSRIPEFIALAEARLNRVLRMRQAEADMSETATVGVRRIALPTGFTEPLRLWLTSPGGADREELRGTSAANLLVSTTSGRPDLWAIDGAYLAFDRPFDAAYEITLRCLRKYALSDASPTNALLSDAPDVYLFATLCEAGPFLRDDTLLASFEGKLSRAIREMNAKEHRSKAMQTLSTEMAGLIRGGRPYNINTGV